ncbi:alpha-L-rhamnosidase [Filimonas lacunae]|uniref:alpha-L-rhamnosidase n=1 Tax=Filimonas lacunae TaxID=477680 RepID=A0A173MDB4_9BACT|nr:family 78 glycoside hydrolase catalytic domain [Filimonas lacunae]BAV05510.1 alpha-L-rhamnosidase [Filimonas lacunae]SIT20657.1 alpha-L-rhamnosidase [Filimonas lacunae]
MKLASTLRTQILYLFGLLCIGCSLYAQPVVTWKARWIEAGYPEDSVHRPAIYFHKAFILNKKVKSARVYITSRGLYEGQVNRQRIGQAYLTPGWTSYNKRLQYQEYDVTSLVKTGANAWNVCLGDGWYRGAMGFNAHRDRYGKSLALLCQLEITYQNGKKDIICSDSSWACSEGPIRSAEIYAGETVDARVQAVYDKPVRITNYPYDNIIATENELITRHETFKPLPIITTPKGEKVIDFGQNLTGWVMVKARGKAGSVITIRHAEVLDKAGNFYTENLRSAQATATYTLAGTGEELLEPHFTYFGFRYIAVEGYPGELNPDDFTAVALYSDMKPTGFFECSNPLLNQLQHNIQWGQRGNFLDVPTDCPQRDERLGWTGDAQVFFRTAAFNFDVKKFFSKWLKDVAADQRADGGVPWVVPNCIGYYGSSAGWGDVATIIPWNMYLVYGDKQVLENQYTSMKGWVDYMTLNSNDDLWNKGGHFGDWLSYRSPDDDGSDAITDKYQIAQCFYAYSTQLLSNAASVLGKTEDVKKYEALLSRIKAAFNREYVTASGRLVSNTQTAYVLALEFDLLPEQLRPTAARYLVDNIRAYSNHLTTGFLGTPYLCHVLSRFGYTDVAYQLLLQETFPSWLYPVKKGATTIWERWDGIKTDGSFQTERMNSFNHYAYGAIGDWMYRVMAGINTDSSAPGYKKIIIKPQPGGGLTYCKAGLQTQYGSVSVHWRIESNHVVLDVEVPENTTATVYVPDVKGSVIKMAEVKSGKHHFE